MRSLLQFVVQIRCRIDALLTDIRNQQHLSLQRTALLPCSIAVLVISATLGLVMEEKMSKYFKTSPFSVRLMILSSK